MVDELDPVFGEMTPGVAAIATVLMFVIRDLMDAGDLDRQVVAGWPDRIEGLAVGSSESDRLHMEKMARVMRSIVPTPQSPA